MTWFPLLRAELGTQAGGGKRARVREGGEVQWEAEISDNGIKLQCLDLEKGGRPTQTGKNGRKKI